MSARRPLLLPLVPLYRYALARKNRRFDDGTTPQHHLRSPVISIGSLSAGGAGKTPFLIALAVLLQRMGYQPDVLSRGYGRQTTGILRVDPAGTAATFGDEPLMLARELACPVFVGADRYAAGIFAEQRAHPSPRTVHLLDDGFAHRRLARTLDIALLTQQDVHDTLLPAGNLREPLTSLRRADILVLRDSESAAIRPILSSLLTSASPPAIWTIDRTLVLPPDMPSRPLAFSGIARPAGFIAALRSNGVSPAATLHFRDHHPYTLRNMRSLIQKARSLGANGFITTAKDAVKLNSTLRDCLQQLGPLSIAGVLVTLHDPQTCADTLEQLLPGNGQHRPPPAQQPQPPPSSRQTHPKAPHA